MSDLQLTPQYASKTSGSNTWSLSGDITTTGNATIADSDGSVGEKVLFLFGLPASLPLDAEVNSIAVSLVGKCSSGSFTTEELKANLGLYVGDTDQPFSMGTERTLSLTGHSSGTLTFSASEWGKAFWTRKELLYGNPNPIFGVSLRRVGTKGIEITHPQIVVNYTQSTTLVGSRVAPPFSQVPLNIPEKFDGSGEENTVKSDEVNLLGDALYNIEKASIDTSDYNNDIKSVGSSAGMDMITTTVFVSGTLGSVYDSVYYEEINDGTATSTNSLGVRSAATVIPSLPPGKQVIFEAVGGVGYIVTASGTVFPSLFTPGCLAIRREKNGKHKHRFSFRLDSSTLERASEPLSKGQYQGSFVTLSNPVISVSNQLQYTVPINSPDGSPNIVGMTPTYTSFSGWSNIDPQPFYVQAYNDSNTQQTVRHLVFASKSGASLTKGYKWVDNNTNYDTVEFDINSLATYDYNTSGSYLGSENSRRLFRGGFLLKSSGSFGALSGYGLMITTGAPQTTSSYSGPAAVAWLVKLSNLDLSNRYDWGVSLASNTYYQTFPWPGSNSMITNIGSTYTPLSIAASGAFRFTAAASGSVTVVKLESINNITGAATVLLNYVDNTPLTGDKSGFFQTAHTSAGTTEEKLVNATAGFDRVAFGFANSSQAQGIMFQARIQGIGRLIDVVI